MKSGGVNEKAAYSGLTLSAAISRGEFLLRKF